MSPSYDFPSCICEDFEWYKEPCKHVSAARFKIILLNKGEFPLLPPPQQKTYSQNWKRYRKARQERLDKIWSLLRDLCDEVKTKEPGVKGGRRRLPLGDMVFAMVMKVYYDHAFDVLTGQLRDQGRLPQN